MVLYCILYIVLSNIELYLDDSPRPHLCSRIQVLDPSPGSWILYPGYLISDPGQTSWICFQDFAIRCRISHLGSRVLELGVSVTSFDPNLVREKVRLLAALHGTTPTISIGLVCSACEYQKADVDCFYLKASPLLPAQLVPAGKNNLLVF